MFDLSGTKLVVIILAALIVLGPEELPGMLRRVGRLYGELKRLTDSVQHDLRGVLDDPMRELSETADLARTSLAELSGSVRATLTAAPAIAKLAADSVVGVETEPLNVAPLVAGAPPLVVWATPRAVWAPPGVVPTRGSVWPSPSRLPSVAPLAPASDVGGRDERVTVRGPSAS